MFGNDFEPEAVHGQNIPGTLCRFDVFELVVLREFVSHSPGGFLGKGNDRNLVRTHTVNVNQRLNSLGNLIGLTCSRARQQKYWAVHFQVWIGTYLWFHM